MQQSIDTDFTYINTPQQIPVASIHSEYRARRTLIIAESDDKN